MFQWLKAVHKPNTAGASVRPSGPIQCLYMYRQSDSWSML